MGVMLHKALRSRGVWSGIVGTIASLAAVAGLIANESQIDAEAWGVIIASSIGAGGSFGSIVFRILQKVDFKRNAG